MFASKSNAFALTIALGLLAATPMAQAEAPPSEQPVQSWNLRSGTEFGKGGTRSFTMTADYSGHVESMADDVKYPTVSITGLRTKAPATVGAPGASVTTDGGISAGYGTERIRGHLGFDAALEQELRRSQQVTGGIDLAYKGWSAMLEGSHRRTDFNDFNVTVAQAAALGIVLPTDGLAGCSVTDHGVGAKLGYDAQTWTISASGNWNSYKKADCSFDVTAAQNATLLDETSFAQLSGSFLLRAIGRTAGRIGRQAQLLKSDMTVSFSHMIRTTNVTVDYDKSKDQFGGATQSTYEITGSHPVGDNCSLELALGTTVQNSKKSPYLGLFVSVGL